MLDWLIVGGGIHGTYMSYVLRARVGVPADRVRVLDPYPAALARWNECTRNTGMPFLRSPVVHHLGLNPFDLQYFARKVGKPLAKFTYPYDRPGLDLFRAHCAELIAANGLDEVRVRGWARGMAAIDGGIRIETDEGDLTARRVLLAVGLSEQPHWPDWADAVRAAGGPVHHIFTSGFSREALPDWTRAVVVGGGITAAQTAVAMGDRLPGTVTLLSRHEIREKQFDSDPGWLGPKNLHAFQAEKDLGRRRAAIKQARHRGSMPPDVARALRIAVNKSHIEHRTVGVTAAESLAGGGVRLRLDSGETLDTDCLVLATGFEPKRPGGEWLDRAIDEMGLPCAPCGYPIVDKRLRWHRNVYVTGPLGELELGPAARNIAGARHAGDRIARSV